MTNVYKYIMRTVKNESKKYNQSYSPIDFSINTTLSEKKKKNTYTIQKETNKGNIIHGKMSLI